MDFNRISKFSINYRCDQAQEESSDTEFHERFPGVRQVARCCDLHALLRQRSSLGWENLMVRRHGANQAPNARRYTIPADKFCLADDIYGGELNHIKSRD